MTKLSVDVSELPRRRSNGGVGTEHVQSHASSALAASGGLLGTLLAPSRFASAAVGSTLDVAYNVNLPSFDPQKPGRPR